MAKHPANRCSGNAVDRSCLGFSPKEVRRFDSGNLPQTGSPGACSPVACPYRAAGQKTARILDMNGGEPLFFKVRKRGRRLLPSISGSGRGRLSGCFQKNFEKSFLGKNHSRVRSFFSAAAILSLTDCLLAPSWSAISCKV